MKIINNQKLFSSSELINLGIKENTLYVSASRQRRYGGVLYTHTKIGKEVYFYYEGLPFELQTKISDVLFDGNAPAENDMPTIATTITTTSAPTKPVSSFKAKKFEAHLFRKQSDIDFIQTYKVGGKQLSYDKVRKYIDACSVLDFISKSSIKQIKELGYKNRKSFYCAAIQHIQENNLPLPTSEARLRSKANLYANSGAISIVSKRFGKANNVKVGKTQEALILELMGKHNQFDCAFISKVFNTEAAKQGWETISRRTVLKIFNKNKNQITGSRQGIAAFRNTYDHTVKRLRPSAPNLLWVGDAWDFELFYQKRIESKNGGSKTSQWERKKVYMVIDAYNDYIVGFSIADSETVELAKLAWKDACLKQNVLPYQIKTDNNAKAQLTPFYKQLCYKTEFYTPSALGNARDKVIERVFGQFYNDVVRMYPNASGRNINAKEQTNRDVLNSIKNSFPDEKTVMQQIQTCIHTWNNMALEKYNGLSREQQYKQADHARNRQLTDLQKLEFFGILRNRTVTYTKEGLVLTIDGNKITYRDWNNTQLMESIGIEFQVVYEPSDLSKILLVADEGRIKHLVQQEQFLPMALADMKTGDRTLLNQRLNEKQRNIQENVINKATERANILRESNIKIPLLNDNSAESIYKLMPIISGKQKANIEQSENELKIINTGKEVNFNETKAFSMFDNEIDEEYKIVE